MNARNVLLGICAAALVVIATVEAVNYFSARAEAKAERIRRAVATHNLSGLPPEWQAEALHAEIEMLKKAHQPSTADYDREDRQRAALGLPPRKP